MSRPTGALILAMLLGATVAVAGGADPLAEGYRLMYGLEFDAARVQFLKFEAQHPEDPRGPVSEAANILFAEFHRLGILESQFLIADRSYVERSKLMPNAEERARFDDALARSDELARLGLAGDARNTHALFAMALGYGLRADYAALIQGRSYDALQYAFKASELAKNLLAIDPGYHDAYLSTGMSQYIVGNLIFPVRWLLRLAGYQGDKKEGLRQLRLVAERGRLLAPFARLLLALAYLRDNSPEMARMLLVGLRDEFPKNPLFSQEIQRIDGINR